MSVQVYKIWGFSLYRGEPNRLESDPLKTSFKVSALFFAVFCAGYMLGRNKQVIANFWLGSSQDVSDTSNEPSVVETLDGGGKNDPNTEPLSITRNVGLHLSSGSDEGGTMSSRSPF